MTPERGHDAQLRAARLTTAVFILHGAATILLGLPLALREITPNTVYGFRIPITLDDPRVWYAVNRVAGFALTAGGVGIAAGALLLYSVRERLRARSVELIRANIVLSAALLVLATLAWVGAVWLWG